MTPHEIIAEREAIIARCGPWTAHNIHLGHGIYTIGTVTEGRLVLRRIVQAVSDISRSPLSSLRVLDLACLEGIYGIEFALHGAKVIGIEGRSANIEKAKFAARCLKLPNIEFIQDDVRKINRNTIGEFDVVLCAGIFYHLNSPDVFAFAETIAEMTTQFAIFDTHISLGASEQRQYKGYSYNGSIFVEHADIATDEQKERSLWASLDNNQSFWLTRASLLNLLSKSGFSSVLENFNPSMIGEFDNRIMLTALKGKRAPLLCSPLLNERPDVEWPENMGTHSFKVLNTFTQLAHAAKRRARRLLPV
jgi:hypothetical protein